MTCTLERSTFVLTWEVDGEKRFLNWPDWTTTRAHLDPAARALGFEQRLPQLLTSIGALDRIGGDIGEGLPLGISRAHVLEGSEEPEAFYRIWTRGFLPVVGPTALLEELVRRCQGNATTKELQVDRFTRADKPLRPSPPKPPEEAIRSQRAVDLLAPLCHGEADAEALDALSSGELIWLAYRARERKRVLLARRLGELAWRRRRTCGALNLLGAVNRDLGFLDKSQSTYRRSLALFDFDVATNPYGFVGLAATLRRIGGQDEAYDLLKKVLRVYPQDTYARETFDAVLADMTRAESAGLSDLQQAA